MRHGPKLTALPRAGRVVLADRAQAAAEVGGLRPLGRGEQLVRASRSSARGSRGSLVREREQVLLRARVQLAQQREDLAADQAALRVLVRGVDAERQAVLAAVGLGLLAPDREQRTDDAVLALRLDPLRVPGGDEPVEHGLDLVGGGVPRRAEPASLGEAVAELAELGLGGAL